VVFLACVHLALFLALFLSPDNSLVSSWCDHSMLASYTVGRKKEPTYLWPSCIGQACGSMENIQSPTAENRRGKKEERRKKEETTVAKYNGPPYRAGHYIFCSGGFFLSVFFLSFFPRLFSAVGVS